MKKVMIFALVVAFCVLAINNSFAAGPNLEPTFVVDQTVVQQGGAVYVEVNVDKFTVINSFDLDIEMDSKPPIYPQYNLPKIQRMNIPDGWEFQFGAGQSDKGIIFLFNGKGKTPLPPLVVGGGKPLSYPLFALVMHGSFLGEVKLRFLKAQVNGNECFAQGGTVKVISAPVPTCVNDCVYSGQTISSGNGIRICGNYDADPCLEWSVVIPCLNGQQSVDGKCVAVSPIREKVNVGEWIPIISYTLFETIDWFSITVDPKQWEIKDNVRVYKRIDENGLGADLADSWSVIYSGLKDCAGFLVNTQNHHLPYVYCFVRPKINGFLKIHYVYGIDNGRVEGDWLYEAVSDQMQGAPPKIQKNLGKQLITWAKIKAR